MPKKKSEHDVINSKTLIHSKKGFLGELCASSEAGGKKATWYFAQDSDIENSITYIAKTDIFQLVWPPMTISVIQT